MLTDSLKARHLTPELMDAPDLAPKAHQQALAGLRRLNRAANAAKALAPPVLALARKHKRTRISLLDIACGSGDVPARLARTLNSSGIAVELTLSDRSATALDQARSIASTILDKSTTVHTILGSAPDHLPGEDGSFDILTNSLFLHHLSREHVIATLAQMARRARLGIVISDLARSRTGYTLAWFMCRLLSRSPIVHFDGPVSVRAAWTLPEIRDMAAQAGLVGATVKPSWPARWLLVWEKPT